MLGRIPAPRVWASISLLALLVAALLFLTPKEASAGPFEPDYTSTLSTTDKGANPDITTTFGIAKGAANFAAVVGFIPPEITVPKAAELAIGAFTADLSSIAILGLLNNACINRIDIKFQFMNASIDVNDVIEPPPVLQPDGVPTPDRLKILNSDENGNNIPDGADKYPSFLGTLFKDPAGAPITPRARYFAGTFRPDLGPLTVILQFVIFEPGAKLNPNVDFDPRLGYPSVTVLLDPTAAATKSAVSDFCSPLTATTTTYGKTKDNPATADDESGKVVRQNPNQDATLNFVSFSVAQRDADDDGYENGLDTCPFVANLEDSRSAMAPDVDGIDSACDPAPTALCWPGAPGSQGFDCDGDGWINAGDNCPQTPNADQADDDLPDGAIVPDGGSRQDGIGRACDTNPDSPDGHYHFVCRVIPVNIGAGGTAAINPQDVRPCNPAAELPGTGVPTATPGPGVPTATPPPGGARTTGGATGGGVGGPTTGIGSLSPAATSIPAWAAIVSALGGAGILSGLGILGSRLLRRRRQ